MTTWPPAEPTDASTVADHRDELVAAVRDHAGQLAYQLAILEGGDYGDWSTTTENGEWTVKYEGGDLDYLKFAPSRGDDVYVVSTKRDPEPEPLATALRDYPEFVDAFDAYVDSISGVLDDVSTAFPAVASTDGVVAERDRVLDAIRDVCDRMAAELRRYEGGDYGTFTARVDGTRWELKWDEDGAAYLRVNGSNGVYVLSQYSPPSAEDIREYAPRFSGFVDAYNDEVDALESDLATVDL
ncbi:hypothetical protein G9C85_15695 [Halorubellus sp. JP-L1]|uniref:hypothetical protein n=1 Tax=Halorubellus sp. JP-L1 TaxID=2715753 RepID=UPI00140A2FF8|nr:hypothetical protein [Halorubellus sp. JP-L1]